jgi:hypothetical protein
MVVTMEVKAVAPPAIIRAVSPTAAGDGKTCG